MMQHYFYFSLKANAEAAQTKLCEFAYSVEVRKSNAGTDWLVLVTGISSHYRRRNGDATKQV